MKIYLAGSFRRQKELRQYAAEMELKGHEITSSWLNLDRDEVEDFSNPEESVAYAVKDLQDLEDAHCLVSFTEAEDSPSKRGGRHVEFGIAHATMKALLIVGPRENIFHTLPSVTHHERWGDEVLEELGEISAFLVNSGVYDLEDK